MPSGLPPHLLRPHFSGMAGTGMSALAEWMLRRGHAVSGSDRSFDRGLEAPKRAHFLALGARLFAQDGSAFAAIATTGTATSEALPTCLVVSTAIEASNPEVQGAQRLGLPIVHRSDFLQAIAAGLNTLAVSGTSGKSTVTGMTFHVLEAGGLAPSLISGANLPSITARGMLGNAWAGSGDWLVMEADESDGTLVRYHPRVGVVLNIEKDHKEVSALLPLFRTFADQITGTLVLGADDAEVKGLFATEMAAPSAKTPAMFDARGLVLQGRRYELEQLKLEDWSSRFRLGGVDFEIALPGLHNVMNALAAIAAGDAAGVSLQQAAAGLAAFRGVERRHVRVGEVHGVTVVDDFAHNPAKVKACLTAVKALAHRTPATPASAESAHSVPSLKSATAPGARGGRVLAVFHPHGFAPMKLMGHDIMRAAGEVLGPEDRLYLPDIYYAGGTADTSISSRDLVAAFNAEHPEKPVAIYLPSKAEVAAALAHEARSGDVVVSLGARDPGLGAFALSLFSQLRP